MTGTNGSAPASIYLTGHIDVPMHLLDAVVQALPDHVRATRAEPGCRLFQVTQCIDRPTRFIVEEAFIDRLAFEAHQQRVSESDWGTLTTDVVRSYKITER